MIHETAIIDKKAQLGENVFVGPWTVVGPHVEIGDHCRIESHAVIKGPTKIGCHTHIYSFNSIGEDCQDKKYAGETTWLEIGEHNVIREGCTLHRGTVQGNGKTVIGSHNLLMNYVHVAHDCILGDHLILAGYSGIAGHVEIGDWAILGGYTSVHQFCKIGSHSFSAQNTVLNKDVAPYVLVSGFPARACGVNSEGLKRRGFSDSSINTLKKAYKVLFRQKLTLDQASVELKHLVADCAEVQLLLDFIPRASRGLVR